MSSTLRKKIGSAQQLGGIRKVVLDDGSERGVRAIEVDNGRGLFFRILIDRGMDIGDARFQGKSLAWLSPCGFRHPAFFEHNAAEWLRNFGGGLLVTSGLRNVGAPCEFQGEKFGLHGRIDNLPAEQVVCEEKWEGEERLFTIRGTVREVRVFGENLTLTRTLRCSTRENLIELSDRIENTGFRSTHAGILYHINLGWPLLDASAKLFPTDHPVTPRDECAAAGLAEWAQCHEPLPEYQEQCFYHDLPANPDGMAEMNLENPESKLRFTVSWRKKELPFFTQWKQFGEGEYVLGMEPGTSHVEGSRAEEEKFHTLKTLAEGESFETLLRLKITDA